MPGVWLSSRGTQDITGSLPDEASMCGLEDGNAALRASVLRLHVV